MLSQLDLPVDAPRRMRSRSVLRRRRLLTARRRLWSARRIRSTRRSPALAPALDLIPINVAILAAKAEAALANHAVATQDLTLTEDATPAVALEAEDLTAAAVIGDIDTAVATASLGEVALQEDTAEAEAPESLADAIQDVVTLIAADLTLGVTVDPTREGHALQRGLALGDHARLRSLALRSHAPRSLALRSLALRSHAPPRNHAPQRRGLAAADVPAAVHAPEGPDLPDLEAEAADQEAPAQEGTEIDLEQLSPIPSSSPLAPAML
jgi:hypothetical protein